MLGALLRCAIITILMTNSGLASELIQQAKPSLCVAQHTASSQFTTIRQLQGQGKRSPLVNMGTDNGYRNSNSNSKVFTVAGVVTQLIQGREAGFFMQQTLAMPPTVATVSTGPSHSSAGLNKELSLASTGIFVSTKASLSKKTNIKLNDRVCVTGFVEEYYGMTQLTATADIVILDKSVAVVPTEIQVATADTHFGETLERYEGMKVRLTNLSNMRVTKPLYYDRRWRRYNMILSHKKINLHPNSLAFPGSIQADQQALDNKQRRLYLQLEAGFELTSTLDYMRVNDAVSGIVGVLSYRYGEFRLLVDDAASQAQFSHHSDRADLPPRIDNGLRIASFNVLNYFNRAAGGVNNPLRQNRGAASWSELRQQETKLRHAIVALDADFIGLMEVENNGFGQQSAIQRLLALVNQAIPEPSKRYALIKPRQSDLHQGRYLGTGAITVAAFYRPTKLKLLNTRVIDLPIQRHRLGKAYHRPALTPTFMRLSDSIMDSHHSHHSHHSRHNSSHASHQQPSKTLTISVNHFKSKGSKCVEDKQRGALMKEQKRLWQQYNQKQGQQALRQWQAAKRKLVQDRQGNCAQFRTTAATVLARALANIPGSKIILGDLNSYPQEDPLLLLTDYTPQGYAYYQPKQSSYNYVGAALVNVKTATGFGYHDPFLQHTEANWTYSFKALGRLDYILLSSDLVTHLVTQKIWYINAAESALVNKAVRVNEIAVTQSVFSSSDHEPLFIDLK